MALTLRCARLLSVLVLAACGGESPAAEPRELIVFAASSLRDAFEAIGKDFERAQPGTRVRFNFAGTQALRTQIEHGAPADLLAAADEVHMDALARAGHVRPAEIFARNELVVVVHPAFAGVQSFHALPEAARIVIGAKDVPIGRYTQETLARAGADFRAQVEAKVVSRELNVRQVLARVIAGEADAGIVYTSDAPSARDRVRVVTIPAALNAVARYPVASTVHAREPRLAAMFTQHVLGPSGQAALRSAGFLPPR
jgi:molybdate transport system substrate-binding protein